MSILFLIEASQPNGATYRLAIGCKLHPATWIAALMRLF